MSWRWATLGEFRLMLAFAKIDTTDLWRSFMFELQDKGLIELYGFNKHRRVRHNNRLKVFYIRVPDLERLKQHVDAVVARALLTGLAG